MYSSYDLSSFHEGTDDSIEAPPRQRRRLENAVANMTGVVMIWHFLRKIGANVMHRLVHIRASVSFFFNGREADVQAELSKYPDGVDVEGAVAVAPIVVMPPAHCGVCLGGSGYYE